MSINLYDKKTYKNKKTYEKFNFMTEEEINVIFDSSVLEYISSLGFDTVSSIFRNSCALVQNKLWSYEKIQNVLLMKDMNINDDKFFRNLEMLCKVIKSKNTKRKLYNHPVIFNVLIDYKKIPNKFFKFFDINILFNCLMESEEFNSLSREQQLRVIEMLNNYSSVVLLPFDFRDRFSNIDRILLNSSSIPQEIWSLLSNDELFFVNYINRSLDNNEYIAKYIYDNIRNGISFEELFEILKNKDESLRDKITRIYGSKYYYNRYSLMEKVYHILLNENVDEIIKEKFLKYLLCSIVDDTNISPELMYNTLKRNMNNGTLTYKDIYCLQSRYVIDIVETRLQFYIKFNIALANATYLKGITAEQISKINVKHLNKIVKYLEDATQDELSVIYGTAIKMYLIFGYERSLEILNGKYGEYKRIFVTNVSKCDVSRVEMKPEGKKFLPVIDRRFIDFLFSGQDQLHFEYIIKHSNSYVSKFWYRLYNEYDDILEKCHGQITFKKLEALFESERVSVNKTLITPDVYELNNSDFLENVILGNHSPKSNDELLVSMIDVYKQMKKRTESSIPYVYDMASNGYRYETMKFDDKQLFDLGYRANCCIRLHGVAHSHLLHAGLCRNGRVLLIYDRMGDVVAFSPMKRNGNVLILNSIECIDKKREHWKFIKDAVSDAINDLVNVSEKSSEPIDLVCIGSEAYLKPNGFAFPNEFKTPTIFEKNDSEYKNTDQYHRKLDVIFKRDNFSYLDIVSKNPGVSYMDPRSEVKYYEFTDIYRGNDGIVDTINSIRCSCDGENYIPINQYSLMSGYYNKDWYIAVTRHGVVGHCIDSDYRAREEYNHYMSIVNSNDITFKLEKN